MNRRPGAWARGFGAGVAAGMAATVVLFAYRFATGVSTPQEALTERLILLLPYPVFAVLLAILQHLAKPLGFATAVAATLIGFGLGGVLYAWVAQESRRPRLILGLAAAAVTWLVLTYAFLPVIQGGILGMPLTTVVYAPALPLALGSLAYGLFLAHLSPRGRARGHPSAPVPAAHTVRTAHPGALSEWTSRRDLLRRSALGLLVAAAASRLGTWADQAGARVTAVTFGTVRLRRRMPPEVTSNGQFYRVSKNYPLDPSVDRATWSLEVTGLVARPLKLSYAEFTRAAPSVARYHTLECISNEVGGDLIGNAKWRGIRVRDILALAGVRPEATTVIWRSADGYVESIPLDVALDPHSLLAYAMNGEPLPQEHGAPVRVLLLNRYGMKQPKWLTGIEVANPDFTGYWGRQGWSKEAIVKTGSAFHMAAEDGAAVTLGGWAFAGSRGISKVEISADGGKTWFLAALKEALGVNCWQFWSAEWNPPAPGTYALTARAVDNEGVIQRGTFMRLPDGAEGYHEIRVRVAG